MELAGKAVLLTGGASGIGEALARALVQRGCLLTLADVDAARGAAVAASLSAPGRPCAFAHVDVAAPGAHAAALAAHLAAHGRLDVAVLNAGVEEPRSFLDAPDGDDASWRRALDVNLVAVADGLRVAVRHWRAAAAAASPPPPGGGGGEGGEDEKVVLITSSSAAFWPLPGGEAYSAAKAGACNLAAGLAHLNDVGRPGRAAAAPRVRVVALCPSFTDTPLVARVRASAARGGGGGAAPWEGALLSVRDVVAAALAALADRSNAGRSLAVLRPGPGGARYMPRQRLAAAQPQPPPPPAAAAPDPALAAWAAAPLPSPPLRVVVTALSADFRAATAVQEEPGDGAALLGPSPPGCVTVRRLYAGVNASDVNFTSGRYFGGGAKAAARLPFTAGFESVGVVRAVGAGAAAAGWRAGDAVASLSYGGFAELAHEPAAGLLRLPPSLGGGPGGPGPRAVALLTSGLTASVALEQAARLVPGETVLVTAAAGGTGAFAVQLAALAGCRVVATCGGPAKAALLARLLAACPPPPAGLPPHAVIDHRAGEAVAAALRRAAPRGVDAAYESVGGDMFAAALAALRPRGRLVVIGQMGQYASGWAQPSLVPGLAEALLWKSASCVGFFLPHYSAHFQRHLDRLAGLAAAGRLEVLVDPKRFEGLGAAADAVAWLQSGASAGKVVLTVARDLPPQLAQRAEQGQQQLGQQRGQPAGGAGLAARL